MKLTLRQMEIFLNVVASGHLTNVAKEMNLSQSAISMSIKELESILGRPVFDRINKRLVLNEVGRAFCKEIEPLFRKLSDIEYEFQNSENKGMIRVGVLFMQPCDLRGADGGVRPEFGQKPSGFLPVLGLVANKLVGHALVGALNTNERITLD